MLPLLIGKGLHFYMQAFVLPLTFTLFPLNPSFNH